MPVAYTNNAASTLSATITNVTTSMSVAAGHGSRFPSTAGGDHFYITLTDSGGNIEIMKVTARSTDTFTVVRGQDGTTARSWAAGDKVELRLIKALLDDLFSVPKAIGNTTANTGAFTTVTATAQSINNSTATYTNANPFLTLRNANNKACVLYPGASDGAVGVAVDGTTKFFIGGAPGAGLEIPLGNSIGFVNPGVAGYSFIVQDSTSPMAVGIRSGTSAQTVRVYNTFTDASNYERGKFEWSGNVLRIGTEKAGTGAARALEFQTDGTTRATIATDGLVTFAGSRANAPVVTITNNTSLSALSNGVDIFSPNLTDGDTQLTLRFGRSLTTNNGAYLTYRYISSGSTSNRIQLALHAGPEWYFNAGGLFQLNGTTSSFPALKRSSTTLQVRLADDSGDAPLSCGAFTTSGNVGIGVTPTVTLDVNGPVKTRGQFPANQTSSGGMDFRSDTHAVRFLSWGSVGNNGTFEWLAGSGGAGASTVMLINGSGNVGIGTTPTSTLDVNGTITITGTGRKIIGDWANATLANRPAFSPSTANSPIGIPVVPTGTGAQADINLFAGSDIANAPYLSLSAYGTLHRVMAEKTGTGTYYPLAFYAGGIEGYRLLTNGNVQFNKGIVENVFTITDGASVDIDPTNGTIQQWTLGANRTPTATNFTAGESVTLMINDGTAYSVTWTTIGVVWVGGSAPTLATTGWTVIELWEVGTTVYGALVGTVA